MTMDAPKISSYRQAIGARTHRHNAPYREKRNPPHHPKVPGPPLTPSLIISLVNQPP